MFSSQTQLVQHLSSHIIRQIFPGAPLDLHLQADLETQTEDTHAEGSGRPGAGSSIKLAFLCPLLVKLPSAVTQDLGEMSTTGELDRPVHLRAEDSGLGVETEVRQGRVFVFWLFQFCNKQLPLVPSLVLVEPAD